MIKLIFLLLFPICVFSQGSFIVGSGTKIIGTNSPIVTLYNYDLENNTGENNLGSGVIWAFNGTTPQTINGTYIPTLYGLKVDNPNGFTLQANTVITNRLDMTQGNINLDGYTLEIGTGVDNPGIINWTNGTINGPIKRWFGTTTNPTQESGIFPIGTNIPSKGLTNRYVQVNFTENPTGGYIIAEYKLGVPSTGYSGLPLNYYSGFYPQYIQDFEEEGYWEITPYNSSNVEYGSLNTTPYTLKLRLNNPSTVTNGWTPNNDGNDLYNSSTIRIIRAKGPDHLSWELAGTHVSVNEEGDGDYYLTSSDVVGFSWFNAGGNNQNPLPVELLYFEGSPYPIFNVLKWSTASEHNSSYFDLERSRDGEKWEYVATIKSAGNSNQTLNYSYIDYTERVPVYYYRLNQVDIDGKSKMYGPIVVYNNITIKRVVKYINLAGQEVPETTTGVVFEIYEDGTSKKIIR
jgi:hypothetical protein